MIIISLDLDLDLFEVGSIQDQSSSLFYMERIIQVPSFSI